MVQKHKCYKLLQVEAAMLVFRDRRQTIEWAAPAQHVHDAKAVIKDIGDEKRKMIFRLGI